MTEFPGNCTAAAGDQCRVNCDPWREALSALADGEEPGIDLRLLTVHVERCPACRRFAQQVEAARMARAAPAAARPTRSFGARLARLHAAAERAAVSRVARWGLAIVAAQVMAVSVIALAGRGSESIHAARHLGAFTMAYSVGLVVVVLRPARAATMLPVAAVLSGALAITAIIDLAEGHIPLVDEVLHLPELFSVLLLWLIARGRRRDSAAAAAPRPALRLVEPAADHLAGETG